jgi:hypothetical protein
MENEYVSVTLLPEMGRVYSMVYRPTGSETLWRNDIVQPGRANNETGWWLWLGGIEYTLPGDEHGTTWALPWRYSVLEDSPKRKALRVEVTEPGTGLRELITFCIYPGTAYLESEIQIQNSGSEQVKFAHWVNPMWVPGGKNELTDETEFVLPTRRILIDERWEKNLGPSGQDWAENPLRFIRNWNMGDIMADGLEAGFYGAYSHDSDEGVVRIFDPLKNPGVDIWTYGFHPKNIPMGSGSASQGYVEIWGGTVKRFPDEVGSLEAGGSLEWTEWIYPFQKTRGLTYANENAAIHFVCKEGLGKGDLRICPTRSLENVVVEVRFRGELRFRESVGMSPRRPYLRQLNLKEAFGQGTSLTLSLAGVEILRFQPGSWSSFESSD